MNHERFNGSASGHDDLRKTAYPSQYGINKNHAHNIIRNVNEMIYDDIYIYSAEGELLAANTKQLDDQVLELGKKVAEHQSILVANVSDKKYKAILNPVFISGNLVAIIGLVGDYVRITQYSELVVKIVEILLSESQYYVEKIKRAEDKRQILRILLEEDFSNSESAKEKLERLHLDIDSVKVAVLFDIENVQLDMAIDSIEKRFDQMVFVTEYAGKVVVLSTENKIHNIKYDCQKISRHLKEKYSAEVTVGISNVIDDKNTIQNAYYQAEKTLSFGLNQFRRGIYIFEEQSLELIFDGVEPQLSHQLIKEVLGNCSQKEIEEIDSLIRLYIDENTSLKATSDKLFIHKNTLQYRLNRIESLTHCNPRNTKDLIKLYTALNLYRNT